MPDLVNLTIDGRAVKVPPQTLLIDAAKTVGIEIPAFCYYEGLTLAAACRMCLVEVEKMPKMMTACTLPVSEGMVVRTETEQVKQARKYTLEFLLTNHPLDCPVCDKGGECELQDMVFRYGAGESRYTEEKVHTPEKQFSPVVYFDAPRCILCFRCVRVCNEALGVGALGVVNRGVVSEIAPNVGDHLECDECGACIDICPVGALTSGTYRYQTRPWEMTHVGTICTHCGMAARPPWARATTRSSAATIVIAAASTASSSASRGATPSISTTTPSVCNRPFCASTASWRKCPGHRPCKPWRRSSPRPRPPVAASG